MPPPSWRARYQGTMASNENNRILLNDSLPAASAGRGAFLIAGYCSLISTQRQSWYAFSDSQTWYANRSLRLEGLALVLGGSQCTRSPLMYLRQSWTLRDFLDTTSTVQCPRIIKNEERRFFSGAVVH